jgi:hypothetical protein
MKVIVKSIYNQDDAGSTAFVFDLRNSTNVTRMISWDDRLEKHINFMMSLNKHIYKKLYDNCDPAKFALNDTGDGYIYLFWDKSHALTCLRMAIHVKEYLDKKLPKHNENLGLSDSFLKLDYGLAIHSGGSTIKRTTFKKENLQLSKDFIFGIVANSVSRLESFTKTYVDYRVIMTGNYKDVFNDQAKSEKIRSLFANNSRYFKKSLGRVNIKDGKVKPNKGHNVYALTDDFFKIFKRHYKLIDNHGVQEAAQKARRT